MAEATIHHDELKDLIARALDIIYEDLGAESIQPIGDRVLCRPIQKDFVEKSASGLFVVQDDAKRPRFYLTIHVADAVEGIKPGDIVVTSGYAGQPVEWGQETYRLISDKDVLGVVDG